MLTRSAILAWLILSPALAQDDERLVASDYADRPAEGLAVAERVLANAAGADARELAEQRYQAALIAGYARDHERGSEWLGLVLAEPEPLLGDADGRLIVRQATARLRQALFQLQRPAEARDATLAALHRIEGSTALSKHARAELVAHIRLSASDHGIQTEDYATSLDWIAPIFADSELLLSAPSSAGVLAWAARQRAVFAFELGQAQAAFEGIERVAEQLDGAAPVLGHGRLNLLALLRTRELMIASESKARTRIYRSLETAEKLVARLEAVQGEARPAALRAACNVVRMIVVASDDRGVERKLRSLERALTWIRAEPALLDPEFGALWYAVIIVQDILDEAEVTDVPVAEDAQGRVLEVLDAAERTYGGTVVAGLRSDLASTRARFDYLVTRRDLIGRPAPDLSVTAIVHAGRVERRALPWEDLRGKVVLVEFWNVHCGPCIRAFPELAALEREHADDGLVVLGMTSFYALRWDAELRRAVEDESATEAQELAMLVQFAEHWEAKHRFVVTSDRELDRRYGVLANPTAFLVDREGLVRAVLTGPDMGSPRFLETLDELLGEE